jgi:competence protein ComEA
VTPAPDAGVRIESESGGILVVHVAGRVHRPGVYRLKDGQRIADAVRRAGGRAKGADLDAINLAAKLTDGEQVLVPRRASATTARVPAGGGGGGDDPAAAAGAVISLNSASEEQLETIDGVGPATAQKIIEFRQQNGGFRSVDDLAQISGIGPKRLEAMRPHVGV